MTHLVLHHTGSPHNVTLETIREWHRARGWKDVGYHWLIETSGLLRRGRQPCTTGAHVKGQNSGKLGVALVGDNTVEGREWKGVQIDMFRKLVVHVRFIWTPIAIVGHRDLMDTLCPGVSVQEVL